MNIKDLTLNLRFFSKSASLVFIAMLCFTICDQNIFAKSDDVEISVAFSRPPTTNNGGSGTGK